MRMAAHIAETIAKAATMTPQGKLAMLELELAMARMPGGRLNKDRN